MPVQRLENRALIDVSGEDAVEFLQAIITTNVSAIGPSEAWPGALLTPQGKILFEFLISKEGDGLLLEMDASQADAMVRRLMLYRLRAKVTIARRPDASVDVSWDGATTAGRRDMRFARAGIELFRLIPEGDAGIDVGYEALKIAQGITGGGEDGDATDFFPHDLMMDRNGGLDFKKGCYVGQEVVSRMQHRSTARRRAVIVSSDMPLPAAGAVLTVSGREVGALRRVSGNQGLAIARIDKIGAALTDGLPIMVGDSTVQVTLPSWSDLTFPTQSSDADP